MHKKFRLKSGSLILAPLAGVSDYPFRLINQNCGADLTYVEMLTAKALVYKNPRTLQMLFRGPDEKNLGVQVTGSEVEDFKRAVSVLNEYNFDTLDINMGCPVRKVVKTGCGSALLQDTKKIYEIVTAVVQESKVPVSVKIRLGWDRLSTNYIENADAIEQGGAAWVVVHGRTRSEDYSYPVDLAAISKIKKTLSIPVVGNGNILCRSDCQQMQEKSRVDAVMISRGALGNPWIFREIKTNHEQTSLDEWYETLLLHMDLHKKHAPSPAVSCITMRKHLLWYMKGWPNSCVVKNNLLGAASFEEISNILFTYKESLKKEFFISFRDGIYSLKSRSDAFFWDPKFDMDRNIDSDRTGIAYE